MLFGSFPLDFSKIVEFYLDLPVIPPMTVKGKVIKAHSKKINKIVPKGRAVVEL